MIDDIFYHSFILIESCTSAFEFEEYYLSESTFWKSIKDDIVTSLSGKYHIFWSIRKIRKCWEDFFVEFTEDLILRSLYYGSFQMLVFKKRMYPHKSHTKYEPKESARYKSRNIHSDEKEYIIYLSLFYFSIYYLPQSKNQIYAPSACFLTSRNPWFFYQSSFPSKNRREWDRNDLPKRRMDICRTSYATFSRYCRVDRCHLSSRTSVFSVFWI